ncbi:methionyl-tRNA formyltransferase, mitochondrial [Topomyia yanbarensis]|uniref:methionyl-tRNA formyltransferase, mitochondrial n=1 Tax=Topomyia yanbarensis TaxID=2498891 RepID=UPI00273CBB88|nr:methionyl-tRNA formyltransferase, mitochondrial [Topomyia yanbarensis]
MQLVTNVCRNIFKYRRKLDFFVQPQSRRASQENPRLRILFFGTDNFSLPSLRTLNESSKHGGIVSSLEVVTSFRAKRNPLKKYAEVEKLPLHDWPLQDPAVIAKKFDLGVVVSFGHLIPENLITSFRRGMLNVHASLLPKLRGAAPIVHAIRNGDIETGVTIMKIKPLHFDIGEILKQEKVDIPKDMLMPELHEKLANLGAVTLLHCIENLDHVYRVQISQNDQEATYAPKINTQFAEVRWSEMSAKQVYDLYRSLYSYKQPTTRLGSGEPVKLFKLQFDADENDDSSDCTSPGHIKYCRRRKRLLVCCSDGRLVSIEQLAIGGKKVMSAQEFYNGFLSKLASSERVFTCR